ncbi:hypothetical protein LguiA_025717 [Lonicera macranthoides]
MDDYRRLGSSEGQSLEESRRNQAGDALLRKPPNRAQTLAMEDGEEDEDDDDDGMDHSQKFTEDSVLLKCSERPYFNNLLTLQADSTTEECDLAFGQNMKVVEGIEMKTWP